MLYFNKNTKEGETIYRIASSIKGISDLSLFRLNVFSIVDPELRLQIESKYDHAAILFSKCQEVIMPE